MRKTKTKMDEFDYGDEDEMGTVGRIEGDLFFYAPINVKTICEINSLIIEEDKKLKEMFYQNGDEKLPVINLRIRSYGGDIFGAFSTVDIIKNTFCEVHTHIDGFAASAATIISSAGDVRTIGKHGFCMLHQCSNSFEGKYKEIEDNMYNVNMVMDTVRKFYKKHTKIPSKKLEKILLTDRYMTAEEALQYSIVDMIF